MTLSYIHFLFYSEYDFVRQELKYSELTGIIIGCGMKVHTYFGPGGFLKSFIKRLYA